MHNFASLPSIFSSCNGHTRIISEQGQMALRWCVGSRRMLRGRWHSSHLKVKKKIEFELKELMKNKKSVLFNWFFFKSTLAPSNNRCKGLHHLMQFCVVKSQIYFLRQMTVTNQKLGCVTVFGIKYRRFWYATRRSKHFRFGWI